MLIVATLSNFQPIIGKITINADSLPDLDDLVQNSMTQMIGEGRGTTWQCNHCGKQDKMKINMSRHVESHFSFSHTCPYCAKVYKSRPSLKFHMATKHKD